MPMNRRRFLLTGLATAAAARFGAAASRNRDDVGRRDRPARAPAIHAGPGHVAIASSPNGFGRPMEVAIEALERGEDTLDAVVAAVGVVEADPNDRSVGLGGLPNEDGVVQLDASCMHGPSGNAGAVAALEDTVHAAAVARDVLWHTDHVMLVGEGATLFARRMGHPKAELLTDASRERWLKWKRSLSDRDDWLEPTEKRPEPKDAKDAPGERTTGTINFNACNARGEVSGVTTTSGLAFKLPGRVGDSPIIGAGLYCVGDVGSAGATGRGEAVILSGGANTVIDRMADGAHPQDACLAAIRRMLQLNRMPYLWNEDGTPRFGVNLYAVDVRGRVGGASVKPSRLAVVDAKGMRRIDTAHAIGG